MRYLAQALGRGPAVVRPAMRTGSPLAEADQRLHLDAFAARFDAPLAGRAAAVADELAPDPFETEAAEAMEDDSFRSPAGRGRRRARRAEALAFEPPSLPSSASSPSPASTSRAVVPPPVAASRREPGAAEPALSVSVSPPSVSRAPAPRAAESETRAPVPERSRSRDAVAPELDQVSALPRVGSADARAVVSMTTPAITPEPRAGDAISQALAKVSTWLDRPVPPVEPAPVVVETSRAREHEVPASVARREPQRAFTEPAGPARPHLEIGSIEVEVVTPERPRRAPAPARTPGPSAGSMASVFGWRQR